MSNYTRWNDIRAAHMARAGCEETVTAGKQELLAEIQGYRLAEIRHGALLSEHLGEDKAMRDLSKHTAWYLMGFPVGADLRRCFATVSSLTRLRELIGELDPTAPFPRDAEGPRGRQGSPGKVALPHGWLDDPQDPAVPEGADLMHSGG